MVSIDINRMPADFKNIFRTKNVNNVSGIEKKAYRKIWFLTDISVNCNSISNFGSKYQISKIKSYRLTTKKHIAFCTDTTA